MAELAEHAPTRPFEVLKFAPRRRRKTNKTGSRH